MARKRGAKNQQNIIRNNAPLWSDKIINEIFKLLISTLLYFLFYFLFMLFYDFGANLIVDIMILTFINLISVIAASIISYILISKYLFRKYSNRGFSGYNDIGGKFNYQIVTIFLNALTGAAMLLLLLVELSSSWVMFLLFWFGYKIIIAMVGFIVAKGMEKNALLMLSFLGFFGLILLIGLKMWSEMNL